MIGGGGFAWPRHVLAAYPEVCLDVVEIDQRMIDIAREYFLLDELEAHYGASGEGRLRVFQEDGRVYLAGIAARTYDVTVSSRGNRPPRSRMQTPLCYCTKRLRRAASTSLMWSARSSVPTRARSSA